jgi:thiopeptide-type bacteriocin biosynthesis protein
MIPVLGRQIWLSLHSFLHWSPERVDTYLLTTVAPAFDHLRRQGRISDWFFIRYGEGGPHLRIRARGAEAGVAEEQARQLAAAAASQPADLDATRPDWRPHGAVLSVAYEPEIARYGGPHAIEVAEGVFCRATELALTAIAATPERGRRLAVALDLTLATAIALDLDPLATVRWLRRSAISWRWHRDAATLAPRIVQGPALRAADRKSALVARRWHELSGSQPRSALAARWLAEVRAARCRLENAPEADRDTWLAVWSSQLHMLLNRIGVAPDEERSLCWFVSACLAAPEGVADFFDDSTAAVDRRYVGASAFVLSRMSTQQPRDVARPRTPPRHSPWAGPAVEIPPAASLSAPLATCLARRTSARGDLGGRFGLADLGSLLRAYVATDPAAPGSRPYPSAGSQYVARLRLIALQVEGLLSGQYEVDPVAATLMPLAAAPAVDEIVETSMWFTREPGSADHLSVSTLPAVLGLYVELGVLRARYGLRALRFALLEAGHLAQNLALAAAATGLSVGVIGGFYDDVAHEVFMLDGVDDVLVYLLPVGRERIADSGRPS